MHIFRRDEFFKLGSIGLETDTSVNKQFQIGPYFQEVVFSGMFKEHLVDGLIISFLIRAIFLVCLTSIHLGFLDFRSISILKGFWGVVDISCIETINAVLDG
jgi:hypothetical protein